jgi:hypothetical protein
MGLTIVLANSFLSYSAVNVMIKIVVATGVLFLSLIVLKQKDFMVIYRRLMKK